MTDKTTISFKTEADSLARAISWVAKLSDKSNIKSFIFGRFRADSTAELSVMSQDSFMKSPVTLTSAPSEDLEIAIPLQFLLKLSLPISRSTSDIQLSLVERNSVRSLVVKTSNGNFKTNLMEGHTVKEPTIETVGSVREAEFFDAMNRVSKMCDTNHQLVAVGSVDLRLNEKDETATLMGTDTYSLGISSMSFSKSSQDLPESLSGKSVLIPAARGSFISVPKNSVDEVELVVDSGKSEKVGYRFLDGRVAMFAPNAGTPVSYDGMKENAKEDIDLSFDIALDELKMAISTILDLSWDGDSSYWSVSSSGLVVRDQMSENTILVPIENLEGLGEGESFETAFHRDVIQSSFHPLTTKKVRVSLSSEVGVLEQLAGDGSLLDSVFSYARAADLEAVDEEDEDTED